MEVAAKLVPRGSWKTNTAWKKIVDEVGYVPNFGPDSVVYDTFRVLAVGKLPTLAFWDLWATPNGSFYFMPDVQHTSDIEMMSPGTGAVQLVSLEIASIVSSIIGLYRLAVDDGGGPLFGEPYNKLLSYAERHQDAQAIFKLRG